MLRTPPIDDPEAVVDSIRRIAVCALLAGLSGAVFADEGMWMPSQIPALADRLAAMGFTGDAKEFADLTGQPMGAIVSLGGCSASFVSPDGLIVTNHHCVQGALQYNSTPERNLLQDGFFAKTREEELSNGPGSRVSVTVQVVEVTDDFTRRTGGKLSDRERYDAVDRWTKERIAACETEGYRCRVASFFGGLRWFEIKQLEIRDVRLVYAPNRGIGNFGGETDNWQWPRHVGDFSFYRAYVAPDGKSATFAKENVAYRPKHWLRISSKGASPGDLVFVVGYPGFTERHETYSDIAQMTDWQLPRQIRRSTEQLAILNELAKSNPESAIKAETRIRGLNNGLTKSRGVLDGLSKGGLLEKKQSLEHELTTWIAASPERQKRYGDVLPALAALDADEAKHRERDAIFGSLRGGNSLLGTADTIVQLAVNKQKKDADREPEYQDRNASRTREGMERMQRTLDKGIDRALLRYLMNEAQRLPAGERIELLDKQAGLRAGMTADESAKAIDAFLDRLYSGTKLFDKATRVALLDKSSKEIAEAHDPFLDLASALLPMADQLRDERKARQGARYQLVPRYMKALLEKSGGLVAPDANGTLRVTYGRVTGVDSKDGLFFKPQTTLAGILEKHTGEGEFNAPAREIEAIRALRGGRTTPYSDETLRDVPVNFMSTVDTTGGNSGSATLNARGELCGLLFDGTYDTVDSDVLYDPIRTRSIHVDSRYLLWVLADVDGATRLLTELAQ
jgi:hypothetical protein